MNALEFAPMADPLLDLSRALAARVQHAAPLVAAVTWQRRGQLSALLWQPGVLVTSDQSLPDAEHYSAVLPGGARVDATLAGRDPATNVAVLRLGSGASGARPGTAEPGGVGHLVLAIGSDGEGGVTARMGGIEVLGPAWESMRGGKIDRLVRIGVRLPPAAEGGPVIDAEGAVLGMSTFGPRRSVMVIPSATIARAAEQLLQGGKIARGWLGVGLHEVALPRDISARAGAESGLMVMNFADNAPAAGRLMQGDIVTAIAGTRVASPRAVASVLGPETVGQTVTIDLVRGGEVMQAGVLVAARPA
jgi:S1-C subfamily serine protease